MGYESALGRAGVEGEIQLEVDGVAVAVRKLQPGLSLHCSESPLNSCVS